ncbi:DUF2334 domain-containing protein [Pseudomonas ovata]|uniref:DUF2334 domain-containing protein n=1 Tax=Pseudomonas ovata TaxID=1839709 RepID=UPI000D691E31|nr:DUF2334 domain-containing protein [Pseudomonas ovata]
MTEPASLARPAVLLVLHDVAPCSWQFYRDFIAAVDALGPVPVTWLVVPDFHKRHALGRDPHLLNLLHQRLELGDELALHGYYHCDDAPAPRHPVDGFMRRLYTHEGEFYPLTRQQALARLDAGIDVFERYAWPLYGFVAPAWLMSDGTRQALAQRPLQYTSDLRALYRLPDFKRFAAPGLVWSARSSLRRGASWLVGRCHEWQWRQAPVIRLGLHPVDMQHALARTYWLTVLERLLDEGRQPLTKHDWLATQGCWSPSSRCES